MIKDIDTNNVLCVVEKDLRKKHINRGDKVIFTDDIMSKIYKMYVYGIQTMTKKATNVEVEVERLNEINRSKEKDILDEFKR